MKEEVEKNIEEEMEKIFKGGEIVEFENENLKDMNGIRFFGYMDDKIVFGVDDLDGKIIEGTKEYVEEVKSTCIGNFIYINKSNIKNIKNNNKEKKESRIVELRDKSNYEKKVNIEYKIESRFIEV